MNHPHESSTIVGSAKSINRLLAVARTAKETIPYYRDAFADIDLHDPSVGVGDLPILSKEIVRANQEAMVKPGYADGSRGDVTIEYTSGSTGIPLRLFRSKLEVMKGGRALWQARAAHFPDVMTATGVQVSASALIMPESTVDRTIVLSAFDLRPDRVHLYLDQLDELQPAWLRGHPAILAVLAEGLRRANRRLKHKLSFVESNSGWLSAEARELLAEAFDCQIANHYGTRETYTISYECPAGRMHLLDDYVVAELIHRQDLQADELVVSSLIFETMPFLRYKVGDFVRLSESKCACGNTTPELQPLGGRSNEVIAGTALVGTYVFHVVVTRLIQSGIDQILQYQVLQTGLTQFDVRLVLSDLSQLALVSERFRAEALTILPGAKFSFAAVDHIEPTRGGKVQVFTKCM